MTAMDGVLWGSRFFAHSTSAPRSMFLLGQDLFPGPDVVGNSRFHCRGHPERAMDPAEIR